MTRKCIAAWSALVSALMVGSFQAAGQGSTTTGFVNFPFSVDGMERTAGLYVPPEYDSSNEWPLIVFLHGGGGNGNNNGNALTERFYRQGLVQTIRTRLAQDVQLERLKLPGFGFRIVIDAR